MDPNDELLVEKAALERQQAKITYLLSSNPPTVAVADAQDRLTKVQTRLAEINNTRPS